MKMVQVISLLVILNKSYEHFSEDKVNVNDLQFGHHKKCFCYNIVSCVNSV